MDLVLEKCESLIIKADYVSLNSCVNRVQEKAAQYLTKIWGPSPNIIQDLEMTTVFFKMIELFEKNVTY